jgi:hypothetical protein
MVPLPGLIAWEQHRNEKAAAPVPEEEVNDDDEDDDEEAQQCSLSRSEPTPPFADCGHAGMAGWILGPVAPATARNLLP